MGTRTQPGDDSRPGPRSRLNDLLIYAIAAGIIEGNFRNVVAAKYGVRPDTLKKWLRLGKQYPDGIYGRLRSAIFTAEAEAERIAIAKVVSAGNDDPKFLCWWLERKFPQRWGQYRGEFGELRRAIAARDKEIAELRAIIGELTDGPAATAETA